MTLNDIKPGHVIVTKDGQRFLCVEIITCNQDQIYTCKEFISGSYTLNPSDFTDDLKANYDKSDNLDIEQICTVTSIKNGLTDLYDWDIEPIWIRSVSDSINPELKSLNKFFDTFCGILGIPKDKYKIIENLNK